MTTPITTHLSLTGRSFQDEYTATYDTSITSFNVSQNYIHTLVLPDHPLRVLIANVNAFTEIPRQILQWKDTLVELSISNNLIREIPALGDFINLKRLNLKGNKIRNISQGTIPEGLESLSLSSNPLETCVIPYMPNLQNLYLFATNLLEVRSLLCNTPMITELIIDTSPAAQNIGSREIQQICKNIEWLDWKWVKLDTRNTENGTSKLSS